MPSDRGTLPRGGFTGSVDQQTAFAEPTAPAGRRLPSAPRERKPALAALAVLLIVGGALGAGFLVLQSSKRVDAVEITRQIGEGQRIPVSAMTEVQIASGTGLSYVPWDEASQVTRFYAVNAIPAGTLLTPAMVASSGAAIAGKAVLGLALKEGQLPPGLQVGDHIDIYQVSDSQDSCPGNSGGTLTSDALVLDVTTPLASAGSQAVAIVKVAMNPADAGPVACNASNGIVGIAVLPAAIAAAAPAQPSKPAPKTPPASSSGAPSPGASSTTHTTPGSAPTTSGTTVPSPGVRAG